MKLVFKNRYNDNPKNKPRLYFYAHHEDYEKYLTEIASEILDICDCVIWYKEDPCYMLDESEVTELSQMQVFIILVSQKFLTNDTYIMGKEFLYAKEKHIPILPILAEDGLNILFQEKMGNMQYLSRINTDITAISYVKKLESYLKSVLISDELIKEIPSVFREYIFLSYRKKDREYANELMSLIHKDKDCLDIGIWYDEFLVPGEEFNNSIKDEILKCKIFTMLITPNLVNEENYVLNTELPFAKKQHKSIMPVVCHPTDKKIIINKIGKMKLFTTKGIGKNIFKRLKLKKQKNINVRDKYLLGLAYLTGVNVEVDYLKAIALITDCANSGYLEACEKMASLYYNGIGVKQDISLAIEWQDKYVKLIEEKYSEDFDKYLKMCIDATDVLVDYLLDALRYDEARLVLDTLTKMLCMVQNDMHDAIYLLRTYSKYIKVLCEFKDYNKIYGIFEVQKEIIKDFECDDLDFIEQKISAYNNFAASLVTSIDLFDLVKAEKSFKEIIEIIENNPHIPERDIYLLTMYNNLGHCMKNMHLDYKECFVKAIELLKKILVTNRNIGNIRKMMYLYCSLALTEMDNGEKGEYYIAACEMADELLSKSLLPEDILDIGLLYKNMAEYYNTNNNKNTSLYYYEKVVNIFEEYSSNEKFLYTLYESYISIANIKLSMKDNVDEEILSLCANEVFNIYYKAMKLLDSKVMLQIKEMLNSTVKREYYKFELLNIQRVAECYYAMAMISRAEKFILNAVSLWEFLVKYVPQDEYYNKMLNSIKCI